MIPPFFPKKPLLPASPLPARILAATLIGLLAYSCLAPAYADPVLDKADSFLKAGRADAASAIYQEYLKQHPRSVQPQLALANIAIRRFEYQTAREMLQKALAQHPDSAETAATLGRLFQLWSNSPLGKQTDNSRDYRALAQEHFRQALAIGSNNPLVLTYAADWQLQQDDLVTCERNLRQALQINPTYVPAFQGLTRFYIKVRDLQRARETILHATELDPLDHMNFFLTAQLLAIANRPMEAIKYGLKSEQLDYGRLPQRDYFLATQFEKLGESGKALQYYENLAVYTPKEAQVWLKLGELHEALNRPQESQIAFRKALALQPDILNHWYVEARENTRLEKASVASKQWRRLLNIQSGDLDTLDEGISALASLHYLNYYYHPGEPTPEIGSDIARSTHAPGKPDHQQKRQLDILKMQIARQGSLTTSIQQALQQLSGANESDIAGEAAFLLSDLAKSTTRLEEVDGLSALEYTQLADRLLLAQELEFSKAYYQRAQQLEPNPSTEAVIKRIQAKQSLAKQRVDEGNAAFSAKKYEDALAKYEEARRIYPEWSNVYLRLGDTYETLKKWPEAKKAYDTAISLSPGLMDSQGFAKNYKKLSKKASRS